MSEKKVKVSEAQARVIARILEGWELGYSKTQNKYWLQQRGIGRGGSTEKVAKATGRHLQKMKVVVRVEPNFPAERYRLAEACALSDDQKHVIFSDSQEQHDG